MTWNSLVESSKVPTQYFIPENLRNDVGKISEALRGFITQERIKKMEGIVAQRSRQVLTVFENTHHAHNISAILRTVDAFGFLDLFFLYSNQNIRFKASDAIDRRASQWLMPKRLNTIQECCEILKKSNYKIALVSLPDFSRTSEYYVNKIPSFTTSDFHKLKFKKFVEDQKIALIFGSELHGISPEWNKYADMYISVKMYGFMESLNVSVCAGIILQSLRESLVKFKKDFLLNEHEQLLILEHWISKTCPHAFEYVSNRVPELLKWFEFVRSGNFFQPISK